VSGEEKMFFNVVEHGYSVTVINDGNVTYHYHVSNPDVKPPVPLRTLRKWAQQTAKDIAEQLDIPPERIFEEI
jgi:hypothetical protein